MRLVAARAFTVPKPVTQSGPAPQVVATPVSLFNAPPLLPTWSTAVWIKIALSVEVSGPLIP
jgi:hypothetical protein